MIQLLSTLRPALCYRCTKVNSRAMKHLFAIFFCLNLVWLTPSLQAQTFIGGHQISVLNKTSAWIPLYVFNSNNVNLTQIQFSATVSKGILDSVRVDSNQGTWTINRAGAQITLVNQDGWTTPGEPLLWIKLTNITMATGDSLRVLLSLPSTIPASTANTQSFNVYQHAYAPVGDINRDFVFDKRDLDSALSLLSSGSNQLHIISRTGQSQNRNFSIHDFNLLHRHLFGLLPSLPYSWWEQATSPSTLIIAKQNFTAKGPTALPSNLSGWQFEAINSMGLTSLDIQFPTTTRLAEQVSLTRAHGAYMLLRQTSSYQQILVSAPTQITDNLSHGWLNSIAPKTSAPPSTNPNSITEQKYPLFAELGWNVSFIPPVTVSLPKSLPSAMIIESIGNQMFRITAPDVLELSAYNAMGQRLAQFNGPFSNQTIYIPATTIVLRDEKGAVVRVR